MRQQAEKDEAQKDKKEIMVEEVVGDMLADPFNDVFGQVSQRGG